MGCAAAVSPVDHRSHTFPWTASAHASGWSGPGKGAIAVPVDAPVGRIYGNAPERAPYERKIRNSTAKTICLAEARWVDTIRRKIVARQKRAMRGRVAHDRGIRRGAVEAANEALMLQSDRVAELVHDGVGVLARGVPES